MRYGRRSASSRMTTSSPNLGGAYLGLYFAASQLAFLALVYAFAKIDWAYLQREHKLRLRRAEKDEGGPGR